MNQWKEYRNFVHDQIFERLPRDLQVTQETDCKINSKVLQKQNKTYNYRLSRKLYAHEHEIFEQIQYKATKFIRGKEQCIIQEVNELLSNLRPCQKDQLFSKESFKELKGILISKLKEAKIEGKFVFKFNKEHLLGYTHQYQNINIKNAILKYKIMYDEKEKLEQLGNQLKELLPQLDIESEILGVRDKDKFIQKLVDVFRKEGIEIKVVKRNLQQLEFQDKLNGFALTNNEDVTLIPPKYPIEIYKRVKVILCQYIQHDWDDEEHNGETDNEEENQEEEQDEDQEEKEEEEEEEKQEDEGLSQEEEDHEQIQKQKEVQEEEEEEDEDEDGDEEEEQRQLSEIDDDEDDEYLRENHFIRWAKHQLKSVKQGCFLGVGDQFQPIQNCRKLEDGRQTLITHNPGQILVVQEWIHSNDQSRSELAKNQKLLKKQGWGDKVRFIALSKSSYERSKKYLDQNSHLTKIIEFYFPTKRQIDTFGPRLEGGLHYTVVDKTGVIRVFASVCHVKKLVNQLLQNEDLKSLIHPEQFLAVVQYAKNNEKNLQGLGTQRSFTFKIKQWNYLDQYTIPQGEPTISYYIPQNKFAKLNEFLNGIFTIEPKKLWKVEEDVEKTFDIPFPGVECVLCKAKLSDQVPQYYSPFKNEFVCTECAEADDETQEGIARYKYTDTLIFINAPLTDNSVYTGIEEYKKGENLKLPVGEIGSQFHDMICNGCREEPEEGPRYIAISARPGKLKGDGYIDYCSQCFAKLKDKNSDMAKQIIERDQHEGMTENALLLRVLFNTGGYYKF